MNFKAVQIIVRNKMHHYFDEFVTMHSFLGNYNRLTYKFHKRTPALL